MRVELDLSGELLPLEAMAEVLSNVEQGRGADGLGHGQRRKPEAEPEAGKGEG